MTIQHEAVRVAGSHGQSTAGFIVKMINESEVDEYLKAIFDAVKERKFELELSGGLPGQKVIPQESIDVSNVEAVPVALPVPPVPPTKGKATKGNGRFYAHKARPPIDMKVDTGSVMPLRDMNGIEPNATFSYGGLVYSKRDVVDKCYNGMFDGHSLRFQVTGVGPKAVKVLLVDEPPSHIQHNGKSLHTAWQNNEPVFVGHGALAPWLNRG